MSKSGYPIILTGRHYDTFSVALSNVQLPFATASLRHTWRVIHSNCWFPQHCTLPHSPVVLSKFSAVTNLQINRVVVLIRYNWGRSHEIRDDRFLLRVGNRFLAAGGRACECECVRGHHKVTHVRTLVACCRDSSSATHVSSVPNI